MAPARGKTNVVWVHGGCFAGGSASYDQRARAGLEALGYRVHAADFPLREGAKAAVEHIAAEGTRLEQLHEGSTSVFVGVSSGGALAHAAALVEAKGRGAVLVCPALRPHARHAALPPELADLQLRFFGDEQGMMAWERAFLRPPAGESRRGVAYGTCDERAAWTMPDGWSSRTEAVGVHAGHELCKSVDVSLLDHLIQRTALAA